MKTTMKLRNILLLILLIPALAFQCEEDIGTPTLIDEPIFLLIDEESIDNGNEPNDFSNDDVNDPLARVGLRTQLDFFQRNVDVEIDLYTGQVGDEGWFALKTIPDVWKDAGPNTIGAQNFWEAGSGLGSGNGGGDDDKEVLLDDISDVTPLRATGLAMLIGKIVVAVVYDSDISINYSPLKGNLQGANLGTVAFEVIDVVERTDGSSSSLPKVRVRILDVRNFTEGFYLFSNAPIPSSSSEPFDIAPPSNPDEAVLVLAP